MYKATFKQLGVAFLVLMLSGCTKQNLDSCKGFTLRLRYELNSDRTDQFRQAVGDLRVYAFDMNGLLAHSVRVNAAHYPDGLVRVPVPDGTYDVSVMAVDGADAQSSYLFSDLLDADVLSFEQAKEGVTRAADFRTMLSFKALPENTEGKVAPQRADFDHLFYGAVQDMRVEWVKNQIVDVDLIRNTHTLDIHVGGISHLRGNGGTRAQSPVASRGADSDMPVQIFMVGANGWYRIDNMIGDSPSVRYEPYQAWRDEDNQQLALRTQRMLMKYHTEHPLMLYIRERATGYDLVSPIDLLKAIRTIPGGDGRPLFRTQEDLDRAGNFPIDISVSSKLGISVSIMQWEIIDVDGGIVTGPGQ